MTATVEETSWDLLRMAAEVIHRPSQLGTALATARERTCPRSPRPFFTMTRARKEELLLTVRPRRSTFAWSMPGGVVHVPWSVEH